MPLADRGAGDARAVPAESAEALRVLGRALLDDVDGLADRLALLIVAREPVYTELDMLGELRDACRVNLERGVQVLAERVPGGVDPKDISRQIGRRRARQGVPLEAVLRAYRLGGRVIWEALLAMSRRRYAGAYDSALLDAASSVWRVNDGSSAVVVEAYRAEERRLQSHDLGRRHAVLDGLIEGRGGDPGFLRDAAIVLELAETGPLLCVVAPLEPSGEDPLHAPQEALAARGIRSVWFVRTRDEVGLVALGARPVGSIVDALRACAVGRVGVSGRLDGLAGVDTGYRMAVTAARTLTGPDVAVLDDRLPEALLVDSPELAPRLVRASIQGLLDLAPADRDTLLATLEALRRAAVPPPTPRRRCSATATPSSTASAGSRPPPGGASPNRGTASCSPSGSWRSRRRAGTKGGPSRSADASQIVDIARRCGQYCDSDCHR